MGKIFNQAHFKVYGEKAIDFALLAAGALIFGQLISGQEFAFELFGLGLVFFALGVIISYFFLHKVKGGEKHEST